MTGWPLPLIIIPHGLGLWLAFRSRRWALWRVGLAVVGIFALYVGILAMAVFMD